MPSDKSASELLCLHTYVALPLQRCQLAVLLPLRSFACILMANIPYSSFSVNIQFAIRLTWGRAKYTGSHFYLIHKNVLIISGTHFNRFFKHHKCSFPRKSARCMWVLVVTEFVVSGTPCKLRKNVTSSGD